MCSMPVSHIWPFQFEEAYHQNNIIINGIRMVITQYKWHSISLLQYFGYHDNPVVNILTNQLHPHA